VPPCCWTVSNVQRSRISLTYNHSVDTSTREAGSADEVLSRLELIFEICLALDRAIGLGGAIIEALVDGESGRNGSREGQEKRRTHFGS
jgi:hypothetical protein